MHGDCLVITNGSTVINLDLSNLIHFIKRLQEPGYHTEWEDTLEAIIMVFEVGFANERVSHQHLARSLNMVNALRTLMISTDFEDA